MTLTPVSKALEAELRAALPEAAFRELTPAYLEEPRGRYTGDGGLLVAPASAEEVSVVVKAANAHRVGIVPYGGGTGLVGGQVAPDGPAPIILSMERMKAVRSMHPLENVMIVEAGAILADVQAAAEEVGRLFPLSLASEGSARIGGILATNAGGVNVLRYGNARDLCLGLEAVLPDGTIWQGLSRLRKDNTGYDLRNLLIGSEGSLGIITAATLKLFPRPVGVSAALMVVEGPEAALELLALAGERIGSGVSAFELIHRQGLEFLAEKVPEIRQPFEDAPDWTVLIDVGMPAGLDPAEALEGLFEVALEAELVSDGVIAQSEQQRADFWSIREHIPEANRRIGAVSSHDISVPIGKIPEFIAKGGPALAEIGAFRINCFGHVGDGNLHYNVFPMPGKSRADHENQRDAIKRSVHDLVHAMGGSVSAEHGIGRLKVADLERYGDPAKLAAMRAIKNALDPNGVMNPGAILPV
ncbi:FAD-binding oxidoreductase [Cognatishimia sp. MH4019]|uniref:FAD-binding oxidoreductase n=1 Tax=Cognatishimia sp. MH4019 TaxID=2854030 RepID=UPI001CD53847|nr:FAD-binding oxidoreductase [Cognatishimia sp. MH4019]